MNMVRSLHDLILNVLIRTTEHVHMSRWNRLITALENASPREIKSRIQ